MYSRVHFVDFGTTFDRFISSYIFGAVVNCLQSYNIKFLDVIYGIHVVG